MSIYSLLLGFNDVNFAVLSHILVENKEGGRTDDDAANLITLKSSQCMWMKCWCDIYPNTRCHHDKLRTLTNIDYLIKWVDSFLRCSNVNQIITKIINNFWRSINSHFSFLIEYLTNTDYHANWADQCMGRFIFKTIWTKGVKILMRQNY